MNVRDATPEDEPWILDALAEHGDHDPGFRWYQYVVVTDEEGERVGFGRLAERDEDTAEVRHSTGVGERSTVARAYAIRELVERALAEDYDAVTATASTTRPFEAVGFQVADDESAAGEVETQMRWTPSDGSDQGPARPEQTLETDDADSAGAPPTADQSEQPTNATTNDPGETDESTTIEADSAESAPSATDTQTSPGSAGGDQSDDEASETSTAEPSYKYDPSAQPTDASTDSPPPPTSQPDDDASTEAAARRQGFDPNTVDSKYDPESDSRSRTTKYDTGGSRTSADDPDDERAERDTTDDEASRSTKYDTDEDDEDSDDTKYSI